MDSLEQKEFDAWHAVVNEWDNVIKESMNEPKYNKLIKAINHWGECLALLRIMQGTQGTKLTIARIIKLNQS